MPDPNNIRQILKLSINNTAVVTITLLTDEHTTDQTEFWEYIYGMHMKSLFIAA
jgi:hypothetical protein